MMPRAHKKKTTTGEMARKWAAIASGTKINKPKKILFIQYF
jgi:hypothetical protein